LATPPESEAAPTKYWLSTLPADIGFEELVDRAKLRWRIERDYQELKQEVGLAHYEGRGWRGLHHHVTLCIAAYGFLIAERASFSPSGGANRAAGEMVAISLRHRTEVAAAASRAAYSELDCDTSTAPHNRSCPAPAAMPLLRNLRGGERAA
jgi:Transposase DDE domain